MSKLIKTACAFLFALVVLTDMAHALNCKTGLPCADGYTCIGGNCVKDGGIQFDECKIEGAPCSDNTECCSRLCEDFVCASEDEDEDCEEETNCESDWSDFGTSGYVRSECTTRAADCGESTYYEYACATGYYGVATGNTSSGLSGCTHCPEANTTYHDSGHMVKAIGTTDGLGTQTIDGCYLASGTYYDITGTKIITTSCGYGSGAYGAL